MKKQNIILLSFLLMLYIVPSLFTMSYGSSTILAQPNMSKDFSQAEYGDESPQSITSFSETLPDDVLFYPDELLFNAESGNVTGGTETNDYTYLSDDDASNWRGSTSGTALFLYFNVSGIGSVASVEVYYDALSSSASTDHIYLYLYNPFGTTDLLLDSDIVAGDATITNHTTVEDVQDYLYDTDVLTFFFNTSYKAPVTVIDADYFSIRIMTLADADHYAESFSDVSDWAFGSESSGLPSESFVTDGDVATMTITCDDTNDEYVYYKDDSISLSGAEYYFEMRYKTTGTTYLAVRIANSTYASWVGNTFSSLAWTTYKVYLGSLGIIKDFNQIESVHLFCSDNPNTLASGESQFWIDYLRISPSTEMGWQHDGSTTQGVLSSSAGDTCSSDGDILTLSSDTVAGAYYNFTIDITSTKAMLSTSYYPFLEINCTSVSEGDGWKLEQFDGTAWATLAGSYITTSGIYRYNINTLDTYVQTFRINVTDTATITFELLKAYSIANWTVTQSSSCTTTDYLYVDESGVLQLSKSTSNYITLSLDPALNIDGLTFNVWNLNISQEVKTGYDFYHTMYWSGGSQTFMDEESRGATPAHTIIDFQIVLYTTGYLSAITFIDNHDWHDIAEAELVFETDRWHLIISAIITFFLPVNELFLNWFLVFLGLCMIPASTVYLVYGGRKSFSTDKLFYALIVFVMGWALLLGGIYI